jgi:hypothetical protein
MMEKMEDIYSDYEKRNKEISYQNNILFNRNFLNLKISPVSYSIEDPEFD